MIFSVSISFHELIRMFIVWNKKVISLRIYISFGAPISSIEFHSRRTVSYYWAGDGEVGDGSGMGIGIHYVGSQALRSNVLHF